VSAAAPSPTSSKVNDDMPENHSDCINERVCSTRHEIIQAQLAAMNSALELRTKELDRRLEGLNQLREEVVRDRDQFLRKDVYDVKMEIHDKFMYDSNTRMTRMETRSVVWGSVVAALVILLQLLSHIFWK
jgi:hypothetical protein